MHPRYWHHPFERLVEDRICPKNSCFRRSCRPQSEVELDRPFDPEKECHRRYWMARKTFENFAVATTVPAASCFVVTCEAPASCFVAATEEDASRSAATAWTPLMLPSCHLQSALEVDDHLPSWRLHLPWILPSWIHQHHHQPENQSWNHPAFLPAESLDDPSVVAVPVDDGADRAILVVGVVL